MGDPERVPQPPPITTGTLSGSPNPRSTMGETPAVKLCSVSVDLDEIHHYYAIHGLPSSARGAHAGYDVALPRIGEYAAARSLPVTLFAVGADLDRPESARQLQ